MGWHMKLDRLLLACLVVLIGLAVMFAGCAGRQDTGASSPTTAKQTSTPTGAENSDVNSQNDKSAATSTQPPLPPGILYFAVDRGNISEVKEIIDAGADVNGRVNDWTPLLLAAQKNDTEMVKLLIENGADVNASSDYGYSPLIAASEKGYYEIAKLLVDAGADVNTGTWGPGLTPLMAASRNDGSFSPAEKFKIVKLLVANGADVNARASDGSTPLGLALFQPLYDQGISDFLKEHGAKKYG